MEHRVVVGGGRNIRDRWDVHTLACIHIMHKAMDKVVLTGSRGISSSKTDIPEKFDDRRLKELLVKS